MSQQKRDVTWKEKMQPGNLAAFLIRADALKGVVIR